MEIFASPNSNNLDDCSIEVSILTGTLRMSQSLPARTRERKKKPGSIMSAGPEIIQSKKCLPVHSEPPAANKLEYNDRFLRLGSGLGRVTNPQYCCGQIIYVGQIKLCLQTIMHFSAVAELVIGAVGG